MTELGGKPLAYFGTMHALLITVSFFRTSRRFNFYPIAIFAVLYLRQVIFFTSASRTFEIIFPPQFPARFGRFSFFMLIIVTERLNRKIYRVRVTNIATAVLFISVRSTSRRRIFDYRSPYVSVSFGRDFFAFVAQNTLPLL